MIVTKIRGGLGNQFFTYAAGRALSVLHNTDLVLDTSWYESGSRPFLLDKFNIVGEIDPTDRSEASDGIGYNQASWAYYPDFLSYSGFKFLSGWWQSESFFSFAAEQIRKDLQLRNLDADFRALQLRRDLLSGGHDCLVALHCRRGDYVALAESGLFNLVPERYYRSAIKQFSGNPKFLFFSDDVIWCERTFSDLAITFCREEDPIEALALMKVCDHFVIGNSTFSWWGAWRGEKKGSRVFAPKCSDWFGQTLNERYLTSDIIPKRWAGISASPAITGN
jgi:Glycosyl transferase family 11